MSNSRVDWQVMNEIALHRGSSPHLNTIDVFVDGQHLTEAVVRVISPSACPTCTHHLHRSVHSRMG